MSSSANSNDVLAERIINFGQMLEKALDRVEKQFLEIKEDHLKPMNERLSDVEGWKNKVLGGLIVTNCILIPTALIVIAKLVDGWGSH